MGSAELKRDGEAQVTRCHPGGQHLVVRIATIDLASQREQLEQIIKLKPYLA